MFQLSATKSSINYLEKDFLPAELAILEIPASVTARFTALVLCLLFVLTLLWAWFGKVDTVAIAAGKLVPKGQIKTLQPVEIGTVSAIHVYEGKQVEAGDLLVELDPTEKAVDKEQVKQDISNLSIQLERLRLTLSHLEKRDGLPRFIPSDLHLTSIYLLHQGLMTAQLQAIHSQSDKLTSDELAIQAEFKAAQIELEKRRLQLNFLSEKSASFIKLVSGSLIAKQEILDLQYQTKDSEQAMAVQQQQLQILTQRLKSISEEKRLLFQNIQLQLQQEILQASEQLTQQQLMLRKAERRERQQQLRAPVSGTIQQLRIHTIGGVVTPAEPLMNLIPANTLMQAEVNLQNKDIGFVTVGQRVEVKLDAFPFTKYGIVEGTLEWISADAVEQQDGTLIYPARVLIDVQQILVKDRWVKLLPGMTAIAEIKTDKRRILDYFISPFLEYQDEVLKER